MERRRTDGAFCFEGSGLLRQGEGHHSGEQVRQRLHVEISAAGLGKGAGDGKAQAAAAIGTAGVAPDEPGRQVHACGQLLPGGVAQAGLRPAHLGL